MAKVASSSKGAFQTVSFVFIQKSNPVDSIHIKIQ